ncbi:UTP--GlnB (protein PII) uridylyltransferase, GlnD [Streptoalloteichus tenebrarius]|uniref:Bifunctional uridylyltransferase/uridylyl-removing enzyme n=1 Tax=Streptoalloteichus tenebrarius (strain ATCC 17920 / DSM 40477 / JCM 4838 / CBS 697.72 / NBRC 16177 / NCIMB 11028 / NRRL B-12390 / A12253. 1 / ISP 5477) TaxID=1933 RepID=A0ABT1I3U5_STRSD|nr:[protein-PII] uridylyltransferase [Streptoalloteichus tenebrarius]MCP2262420.1 UTP--GlnB (protein PII) uridylyltransferase, GlnD [Streptoalloteichus tenebrarius]BFF03362.1 [protein-PII] uridylyltransferase [Streptoalloteichus tenebrarius]
MTPHRERPPEPGVRHGAEDLALARAALLAPAPRQRRLDAASLRTALTDLHDFWLAGHAAAAGVVGAGVALVTVGALARRELAPHSDLDLVLVHAGRRDVAEVADRLWYPLWDAGIGLDHSVRTVDEALRVAGRDPRVAMALVEARYLAGDRVVGETLVQAARRVWRSGVRDRVGELTEAATQRWARCGEVAHRVEPDLKNGRGGLRDLTLLDALAAAQLVDRPGEEVLRARELLLDVRTELHRASGRARDVLRAQDGDEVAAALGMTDRFDLARALSSAGRTVAYAVDVALRAAHSWVPRRRLGALGRAVWTRGVRGGAPPRRPLDDGVVLHGFVGEPRPGRPAPFPTAEVALAREALPGRDAALLLRVAAAAARVRAPIAAGTLARLADTAPELRRPWPREARQELLALLGSGPGLVDVVEALDRTGLWGRLFPEWGAVRDLPPRDAAHTWTVDRHLVRTVVEAARLATTVSRPDLLLLAALLHDVGKGRDGDHSTVGAALARQVGDRIGLWPSDVDVLVAAVQHHLLLPHTATRRDVTDPATVRRVVDTLGGDPVLLELLHALAEADALATGPGVWSTWKAALVADLVGHCRAAMTEGALPRPEPLDAERRALAEAVAEGRRPDVLLSADGGLATVTVVAPDRPGLLSRAAGVLALNSLQVHAAELRGHADVAVDVFTVSPRFGSLPEVSLLREQLNRALEGTLPLAERLAAKERDYGGPPEDPPPPRLRWFDDEASGAVVLELRAADRIGLLHHVAAALETCGVDVRWARASTYGPTAIDAFCLGPASADSRCSNPRFPAADRARIERAVLAALG